MIKHLVIISMLIAASASGLDRPAVTTGADNLVARHLGMLKGKRVGMIVNHTSRLHSGEFLLDSLQGAGIAVTALFGPEHGIRGAAGAGEKVGDGVDVRSGVPVFSLYGERNKPTAEMLQNVDLLLYDIQDVGARFYTYISTLKLCMDAAAEHQIPFVVLDRPNPFGPGVDGPLLEDSLRSFVGIGPIPVVYGMTCGELATFMNTSGWLDGGRKADLRVIWMEGWERTMDWSATGLPWVAPSPNIPTPETAVVYPATCFLEATNVSEGRGTAAPFFLVGAPFLDADSLSAALNARHVPGVSFVPSHFMPASSKHAGEMCHGVRLELHDRSSFRPVSTGLIVISELLRERPADVKLNHRWLGKLLGKGSVAGFLEKGGDPVDIESRWLAENSSFMKERMKSLHYP
jgi:uncharacterized protein YbbC (DUF1343 family)